MPLKPHDWVKVISLRNEGEVLEILRDGKCKVLVGGLVVQCRENDLLFLSSRPAVSQEKKPKKKRGSRNAVTTPSVSSPSIDLHGMLVDEAMAVVASRVDQAILSGADALRVVHGKGGGKIKAALHRYLGTIGVVKKYKLDEKNSGVTWVYF